MISSDRSHSWVKMNGNELLCIQFLYQITVSDVCARQLCQGFVPDHCVRCLYCDMCCTSVSRLPDPRSGELRTQKLKSHLVRTQSLTFSLSCLE